MLLCETSNLNTIRIFGFQPGAFILALICKNRKYNTIQSCIALTNFALGHGKAAQIPEKRKRRVLDLFTRANIAENDPTKKFLVPQK